MHNWQDEIVITINYVSPMRKLKGKITSLKPYNVVTFSRVTRNTIRKRFYSSAMQNGLNKAFSQAHVLLKSLFLK